MIPVRALPLLLLSLTACREGAPPFSLKSESPSDTAGVQLTFNAKDDRAPSWDASGNVFFVTLTYPGLPGSNGLLAKIDEHDRIAQPALPNLQVNVVFQPWIVAPAISPDRKRVAFFDIVESVPLDNRGHTAPGPDTICLQPGCHAYPPLVIQRTPVTARLRVVNLDGSNLSNEAHLDVPVAVIGTQNYDQGIVFSREMPQLYRPAWSPDGTTLIYSDGTQLFRWSIGAPASIPIAGTESGIWPSWSPDGRHVAFAKYNPGGDELYLMSVDSGTVRFIGVGTTPSWDNDGRIIFSGNGRIWRRHIDGTGLEAIPHTDNGYEPALSKDGRRLAFARFVGFFNHDIWVVPYP